MVIWEGRKKDRFYAIKILRYLEADKQICMWVTDLASSTPQAVCLYEHLIFYHIARAGDDNGGGCAWTVEPKFLLPLLVTVLLEEGVERHFSR